LQSRVAEATKDRTASRRILLRVGINVGDVIVEGHDLYGDGVNIAARLEGLAGPGEVLVSGSVHDQVKRKFAPGFDELGPQSIKNFVEPVPVFRLRKADEGRAGAQGPLELPSKPSIAILPFTNMGGDAEHESFADGLTEDLITDLSRNAALFVIARHSSFVYKGKAMDVRQIARELGVRYVLEGSVRRAADRVRINAQLIDAVGGDHVWAERFDRGLEGIFEVQDEVTAKIVEALVGRLGKSRPRSRPSNLEAYDLCVRGRLLLGHSPVAAREARVLLNRAIELDPGYAEALRWMAFNLWASWAHWFEPQEPARTQSLECAQRAVQIDPADAANRWVLGYLLAYERRWTESDAEFAAALDLDPNDADSWVMRAEVATYRGEPQLAIEHIEKALRLNPHPLGWYYWVLGMAHYAAHDYGSAVDVLREESTYRTGSRRVLAASLAQLGRIEDARHEAELFLASNPLFTISRWIATQPIRDEAVKALFIEGYSKAGLPA
jgi:TolB-like protein